MKQSKTFDVFRHDTNCHEVTICAFRDNEGNDGVLFVAWHEEEDTHLIQTDFLPMEFYHVISFIRDYSQVSAQDYIDNFQP